MKAMKMLLGAFVALMAGGNGGGEHDASKG